MSISSIAGGGVPVLVLHDDTERIFDILQNQKNVHFANVVFNVLGFALSERLVALSSLLLNVKIHVLQFKSQTVDLLLRVH